MKFENVQFTPATSRKVTRSNEVWSVDFMMLDFAGRPFVMLVVDVATRRALSATVSLAVVDDVIVRLERLVRRSGRPEQIQRDYDKAYNSTDGRFHPALQTWAQQHGISLTHDPMLQTQRISERPLRDLGAFLREKHFPTLMELGHEIERWRQSYAPAVRNVPDTNQ